MMQRLEKTFAGRRLVIETGRMAKQAAGSAVVTFGETMVLAGASSSPDRLGTSTHLATYGSFVQAHRAR